LPSRPERRQNWRTFLKNHREVIAAMDFFTVPTATFRTLYVLFVIGHGRRDIAHWNITEHPSAQWVNQQLREAFPFDGGSRYLVFDRDTIFSAEVVRVVRSMSIEPTRTSYRSPWQMGWRSALSGRIWDSRKMRRWFVSSSRALQELGASTPDRGSEGCTTGTRGARLHRRATATDILTQCPEDFGAAGSRPR
jgi:hypothetical protein